MNLKHCSFLLILGLLLINTSSFSQNSSSEIPYPEGMEIDHGSEVQTTPSWDLPIPNEFQKNEPNFIDRVTLNAWGFVSGSAKALGHMVSDPFFQLYDTTTGLYYYFTNNWEAAYVWEPKSATWQAWKQGMSPGEQLYTAGAGIIHLPWELLEAIDSGDAEKVGSALTNIVAIALPVGRGLNKINFPARTLEFIPTVQKDGVMALAAVTAKTISIEGVEIAQGTLVAMVSEMNSGMGGGATAGRKDDDYKDAHGSYRSDACMDPKLELFTFSDLFSRKKSMFCRGLFRDIADKKIEVIHQYIESGLGSFDGDIEMGIIVDTNTGKVLGRYKAPSHKMNLLRVEIKMEPNGW